MEGGCTAPRRRQRNTGTFQYNDQCSKALFSAKELQLLQAQPPEQRINAASLGAAGTRRAAAQQREWTDPAARPRDGRQPRPELSSRPRPRGPRCACAQGLWVRSEQPPQRPVERGRLPRSAQAQPPADADRRAGAGLAAPHSPHAAGRGTRFLFPGHALTAAVSAPLSPAAR